MQVRIFAVPALDPASADADLNRLLAAGRVAGLERQFVAAGAASFWAVCVSLADGPRPLPAALKVGAGRKVDYREVPSEADLTIFARLRALRKTMAEAEGVPPYAVFTNEQLAALVTGRVHSLEAMARIEGIGPARVERYASAFLSVLREATIAGKAEL